METKTFKFKEGTVVASVSEYVNFDMGAGKISQTGKFTACLIGGTAPNIKPTMVRDARKAEKIFASEEAAFDAAYELALELGYHPVRNSKKLEKAHCIDRD